MKTLSIVLAVGILSCWLSGCAGKRHAEQYAAELRGIATMYQKEVARKVKAEQDAYQNLAPVYESAQATQTLNMLSQERLERAAALTDDVLARAKSGTKLTPSELRKLLRDYGNLDYSTSADVLAREMDAANRHLANLETLDSQIQQLQTVESVLDDLSKPNGRLASLKDAGGFVQSAKACLDEKVCAALKTELDGLQTQLGNSTSDTEKSLLNQKIQELQGAQKAHNCDASPTCAAKTKGTP